MKMAHIITRPTAQRVNVAELA